MSNNAVYVKGVGMTAFGKHGDRTLKSLATDAIAQALQDADISAGEIEAAYMGNAAAAVITGQVCVAGQIILRELGIGRIPVVNVENACATAATAFQQAYSMVSAGIYDIALACGYEKLFHKDKSKTFSVFSGAVDVDEKDALLEDLEREITSMEPKFEHDSLNGDRSLFIDIYASWAIRHMQKYGTNREQLAAVSVKNSFHGSLNPLAQYRNTMTLTDVLAAREIAWPLTLPMCSPIGDGAAAAILISEEKARKVGLNRAIKIFDSRLYSGWDMDGEVDIAELCAQDFYEAIGVDPKDIDCVELHDASAISEIMYYEYLGLCDEGEGGRLIEEGATKLGGRVPVNTSGGLMRKGHPIGATGLAQIYEIVHQLRGEASARQVHNARIGLAENGGGFVRGGVGAIVMSLLSR